MIRKEAAIEIVKYGMTFRRSALFMVMEKYPNLDFSDINFSDMKGHDSADPLRLVQAAPVQPAEEDGTQAVEGVVEVEGVQAKIVEGKNNTKNVILVSSD